MRHYWLETVECALSFAWFMFKFLKHIENVFVFRDTSNRWQFYHYGKVLYNSHLLLDIQCLRHVRKLFVRICYMGMLILSQLKVRRLPVRNQKKKYKDSIFYWKAEAIKRPHFKYSLTTSSKTMLLCFSAWSEVFMDPCQLASVLYTVLFVV